MLNNSIVVGRLVRDPNCGQTKKGVKYATFSIVHERDNVGADGKKKTDLIPCVAWRETAVKVERELKKGMLIDVTGVLQSRSYMKQGQKVFVVEVIVESFHGLESKSVINRRMAGTNTTSNKPINTTNTWNKEETDSLYQENGSYDPYGTNDYMEITDDDVPF
ncbi:single-stranded DNA-binding protein [Enterococcus rivorum]|uniref:Single-stranded DNA-binding protein n=1 Tax=Enterococcus rivorum TaxID=762845 RepID=A0A1E5L058_9ENTE|nr:single-stranded DNA-binding protein [Enterococcus rivorum]MBP2098819.1 single-strand DNA-binding protein [Enterococcus rivorum]OEH83552.1 hypothetical protein BCR26_08715 [Enterococcus rivorum]